MSGCNHDCSSCSQKCGKESLQAACNSSSNVKSVYAVVSGKGGVGKSLVTSLLAVNMNRKGYKTAVLDADITGPSIPKSFGLKPGCVTGSELGMFPPKTKTGIEVMSVNLLMDEETKPVVWRGPVIAGVVKQFYTDVLWEDIDYLFVDMPPGTGDVPLTVFQSLPLDGVVIVTSPQDLVSMIVKKAYNMAQMMNIPILGIVENMSSVVCPECGEEFKIFGSSSDTIAEELGLDLLGKMPIDISLAKMVDNGNFELYDNQYLADAAKKIDKKIN